MKKYNNSVFTALLNMLSLSETNEMKMVKLNSRNKNKPWTPVVFPASYVKAYIYRNILEFEFYISSDDVTISILNPFKNVIYKKVIDTVDTLHIMVKTKDWPSGIYTINIHNVNDISVCGNFILED